MIRFFILIEYYEFRTMRDKQKGLDQIKFS